MSEKSNHKNEFSRLISRRDLMTSEKLWEITASPEECHSLALRLGVVAISELVARLQIVPWRRNGFSATGEFHASIVQTCVVSLDEFATAIRQPVSVRFTDAGDPVLTRNAENPAEIIVDPLDEDETEILENGSADLGELIVECLATEIDPHPRKPGCDFEDVLADLPASLKPAADEKPNPFAVLSQLKPDDGE